MRSAPPNTDERSPEVRKKELNYREYLYALGNSVSLPRPSVTGDLLLHQIVDRRKSSSPSAPLSFALLGPVLWYLGKTLDVRELSSGALWEHRFPPSAGGRHPIDILIVQKTAAPRIVYLYDGVCHRLHRIEGLNRQAVASMVNKFMVAAPNSNGTLIVFGAQFGRTAAKYRNHASLVWRDVGVLNAVAAITCANFDLACLPLGPTGQPAVSKCLKSKLVRGAGACIIGLK